MNQAQPVIFWDQAQQQHEITPERWQQNQQDKHLLLRYFCVPIWETEKAIAIAVDSLQNKAAVNAFRFLTNKRVELILCDNEALKALLNQLEPKECVQFEELAVYGEVMEKAQEQFDATDPVIQLLDALFHYCLQTGASDIHFEPYQANLLIRVRIDGVLRIYQTLSHRLSARIISRIKLLAKLDIAESRLPQDGQFSFTTKLAEILDFRVSSLPTSFGEKIVLRIQKNKPVDLRFDELGFNSVQCEKLIQSLKQPQGLILVTGPTGSGKSITLYSALRYLNSTEKHIVTAEDPIEIQLDGIIQSQVNSAIGLTFSQLLRTFLRQDPDIIMLGEIRDEESAQMTLKAAQTGHLVLSTLHTNDALSAIERLLQLGIHEYEIKNSLLLVVAQRLVRKICNFCQGQGCEQCYQGYKGRTGIFQLLSRENTAESDQLKNSIQLDFASLHESAKEKIAQGVTNWAEVKRVIGDVPNE